MPSPRPADTSTADFKLVTNERLGRAAALLFYETNHQASQQRRDAALGGESRRNDSLLQTRLASQLALRIMHFLQVKDYRQAQLIAASQLDASSSPIRLTAWLSSLP